MRASPLMYQIPEAARLLGIGRSSFYELLKQRNVAIVKIGRRAVVPAPELDRLAADLYAEARARLAADLYAEARAKRELASS